MFATARPISPIAEPNPSAVLWSKIDRRRFRPDVSTLSAPLAFALFSMKWQCETPRRDPFIAEIAPPATFAEFELKSQSATVTSELSPLMAPPVAVSARFPMKEQLRIGRLDDEWIREIAPPE